jgi:ribosome-associated protein
MGRGQTGIWSISISLNEVIVTQPSAAQEPTAVRLAEAGLKRALLAAQTAKENRGRDIVILDLREQTTFFDYFVLVTGTSRRQLHAISEEIDHALEDQLNDRRLGIEGYEESHWILLDYGDIVVHLFDDQTRSYYALEDLWGRAKRVAFPS